MNCKPNPRKAYCKLHKAAPENIISDRLDDLVKREGSSLTAEDLTEINKIKKSSSRFPLIYSNEFRINIFIRRLLKCSPPDIRKVLNRLYVDLIINSKINAGAVETEYSKGYYFVRIYGGLYTVIDVLGEILARSIILALLQGTSDPNGEILAFEEDIQDGLQKLRFYRAYARTKNTAGYEVTLTNWKIRESKTFPILARNIYRLKSSLYYFVLGHEIGHHFLDHTTEFRGIIDSEIRSYSPQLALNKDQAEEIDADLFGALLYLGNHIRYPNRLDISPTDIAFGPLLAMIAFSIGQPDFTANRSDKYPSHLERFQTLMNLVRDKIPDSDYPALKTSILLFIEILENDFPEAAWFKAHVP